ncbi:MAG: NERD domain-containing protein [Candidatus Promineifilaceae bacterium]
MARMYPNILEISDKISSAEYSLYHQLHEQLGNDYVVFHSVAWQSIGKNGRPQDGEADFIITHPRNGILTIEVKGGNVRYTPKDGKWHSISEGQKLYELKDPFTQAKVAKFTLINLLKQLINRIRHVNIGHAVAFPDVYIEPQPLGADKPRQIVMDMADAANLTAWVEGAMTYWRGTNDLHESSPGDRSLSALMYLLGKTRDLRPAMWGDIQREQRELIRLTQEQYFLLDVLNRQRRAAISGCAGSGKTLLAIEKAVRLSQQGFKVLLTCFNKNLVSFLKKRVGDNPKLDVMNFHKLCFDIARGANQVPIMTDDQDTFYNHLLPEAMMDAAEAQNIKYDAIIVDEGQDFHESWWIPLQTLLRDPDQGILYIFYDDNQQIYGQKRIGYDDTAIIPHPTTFPIETPPYMLTVNCRNTRSIHRQVSKFYRPQNPIQARGPLGRPVHITRYRSPNQLHATLSDTIRYLTREEKIPTHEIIILTPMSRRNSNLWLSSGFRGVHYTDHWPAKPQQVYCNTIHAFKGLESTVVILAEVDRWSNRAKDLDPLLYVACSRAKNHLVVLLPETAPPVLQRRFA